jgi:hypothetical protein
VLVLGVPALAFAFPSPIVACALLDLAPLDSLDDGARVDQGLTAEARAEVPALLRQARARIEERVGPMTAAPRLVFLSDARTWSPFVFNDYGSTTTIASRACVIVGPQGRNVDVVAHELLHAEAHHRLGVLRRARLPTWFDEGLAMQVDDRPRYQLPSPLTEAERARARQLSTADRFFSGDDDQLTWHYAAAKALVWEWRHAAQGGLWTRVEGSTWSTPETAR